MSSQAQAWWKQLDRTQWKAFAASWLGYLLDGFDFSLITLVLVDVQDDFGISTVQATALVSAAFISRWFGGLVLGALGDRTGRRNAMVASILAFSVGSLLCALAPGYLWLFVARLLIGFGMAGEYGASSTYVIESWPSRMRNKASAFLISGFSIGGILAAQTHGLLVRIGRHLHATHSSMPWSTWRVLFGLGLIPVVLALWLRRNLPEPPDWERAAKNAEPDMVSALYLSGARRRVLNVALTVAALALLLLVFVGVVHSTALTVLIALTCTAIFCWFMICFEPRRWPTGIAVMLVVFFVFSFAWPVTALLPTYLTKDVGLDSDQVTTVLSYSGLGTAVGAIVAGFTGDRFGTVRAYTLSLLVSIPLLWPVFTLGKDQVWLLWICVFCQMIVGQGVGGLVPKWMVGYFAPDKRAAALGFTYNVGALGGAVSPVVGASLASHMSLGQAILVLTPALTALVVLLVAINLPYRLQRLLRPDDVWPTDRADADPQAVV